MAKDLDYFKKKIMAILEKQTDETPKEINKSLNDIDFIYNTMNPGTFGEIEKSRGYGIGTVREWKGRKYKKIAPGKWRLIYESDGKGARQSIAYLKKAVMAAKSTDELLEIVMQNINRFTDKNGKTLDIVSELQEAVRSAKNKLNGQKTPETPKTNYKNLSRADAVAEYKRLGKEIAKQEKENTELYEKNNGFGGGLSSNDMDRDSDYQKWLNGSSKLKELMGEVSRLTEERVTNDLPADERNELLTLHDAAYNGKMGDSEETVITENETVETEEPKNDDLNVPTPKIDSKVAARINDISMSGSAGNVQQHDVNVEMQEFKDKFNYDKMNPQQKEYFKERLSSYAGLVGSSYNEMASKRLAAGPSWVVAGPAKYNTKRFNQKMEAERRAYETFEEKKEKFIKNTEKRLKELKYTGGTESVEDVKKRVFEDYSNGKWSYGDKIDNTDPYAIEKISGKIKYMEDAHDVTLLYNKMCKKNGITNWQWADRTDEDKAKRREVLEQTVNAAKEKGYSDAVIKQGIEHPFGQNQTADIRRNKQRLEELQKRQEKLEERKASENNSDGGSSANTGRVDFDGGYVYENPELDRIQIIYDGKPERDVIDKLKHNGFRWSPSQGAWQRQLNRNGRSAVNRVFEETGINTKIDIDGAGEVKKSLPNFVIKGGRFLIHK